jgi:internalin A
MRHYAVSAALLFLVLHCPSATRAAERPPDTLLEELEALVEAMPHYTLENDAVIFSAMWTKDEDMTVLDAHPEIRKIAFVGERFAPNKFFMITDAGFAHLAACKGLQELSVYGNIPLKISDNALKSIAGLTELRSIGLGVSGGLLTDAGGVNFSGLKNLTSLGCDASMGDATLAALAGSKNLRDLSVGPATTDAGLAKIEGLTGLEALSIGVDSLVTDKGMASIAHLTNLKQLALEGARVTDAGLAQLVPLTELQYLWLSNTLIAGRGLDPDKVSGMARLTVLKLQNTPVDDAGLANLSKLANLERLDLTNTKVTDKGLPYLASLSKLRWLSLNDCPGVTDEGLKSLLNLKSLETLAVRRTGVTRAGLAILPESISVGWGDAKEGMVYP